MFSGDNLYAFTGVKWYGLVYHSHQMSLHILMMLMRENLINEQEFTAIDNENRKSFLT